MAGKKHRIGNFVQMNNDSFAQGQQQLLFGDAPLMEDPDYLSKQLITYIGNKRSLLGDIGKAVLIVQERLGKEKLKILDAFSGSGVVSRYLKAYSSYIASNDIEDYASLISRCYLKNRSKINFSKLQQIVDELNHRVDSETLPMGFFEELYAPNDENNITIEDRVFYTKKNAKRLDNYRRMLEEVTLEEREMLLGPLLSRASVHANTSGVFKGFHKNRHTKIGQYGGSGKDALTRINGLIELEIPYLSLYECPHEVFQEDANLLAKKLKNFDLVYLDPPYNQHPYGSNYFMLNLLVNYQKPIKISKVSGIPNDWNRSGYNVKAQSLQLFNELINDLDTKFLLISFNNEGFIPPDIMIETLNQVGSVSIIEKQYNAFRGSRNFNNRSIHTTEYLFLVERS